MCVLHQFTIPSVVKEDINPSLKDKPIYVGVSLQSRRLDDAGTVQKKKEDDGHDAEEEKGFKKE